jgi:hypothetical protein
VIAGGLAGLLVAGGLSLGALALAGKDLGTTNPVIIPTNTEHAVSDDESPAPQAGASTQGPAEDAARATESSTPDGRDSSPHVRQTPPRSEPSGRGGDD